MTGFGHLAAGGGTTGYVVAAGREPRGSAGLAELGLSHEAEPRARSIRRWAEMLEGGYDLHYREMGRAPAGQTGCSVCLHPAAAEAVFVRSHPPSTSEKACGMELSSSRAGSGHGINCDAII
jgi:hypothetical protein